MININYLAHNLGEDNTGGYKAVQTETEKLRTKAVPTSIYRGEHGLFQRELS